MQLRRFYLALLTLLLTVSPLFAQAPKDAVVWSEWETITPEGEEFTVTMPKNPTTETAKFPYHRMELNTRVYLAKSTAGPVLAVASFSGIKSNPAYTEFQRFNSYIDAFKDFFPPKVRTKENAITKLTLVGSQPFHGHTGRTFKLTIGELSGVVHAFVTRKRFYAVVSLNTKKDAALEEKFLSSFVLPERQPDPPKTATAANQGEQQQQPVNEQTLEGQPPEPNQVRAEGEVKRGAANAEKPDDPANNAAGNQAQNQSQSNQKKPISGGVLNSKAIYLPMPEVPPGEVSGVVLVQILVDEQGTVVDARAVSGPQQLHAPAVNAARLARFMPTLLAGVPVQVSGTLSFSFARSN